MATAPAIYANLPYDTRRDLVPIGLTTERPGLYVPTGTPPEVIAKLSAAVQYAVTQDGVRKRLEPYGATLVAPGRALPPAHRAFLDEELRKWDEIFKSSPKTCASTENC